MTSADGLQVKQRVAEFAWQLKNWDRPLGLNHFGRPVQLIGTGMMFPWEVIKSAPLARVEKFPIQDPIDPVQLWRQSNQRGSAPVVRLCCLCGKEATTRRNFSIIGNRCF